VSEAGRELDLSGSSEKKCDRIKLSGLKTAVQGVARGKPLVIRGL